MPKQVEDQAGGSEGDHPSTPSFLVKILPISIMQLIHRFWFSQK